MEVDVAFPEPRLPYPCMSSLSSKDQKTYMGYLMSTKTRRPPKFYQIHEMTSLTGGTFNRGLVLTFEKQLLTMGIANITDHKMVPADAQLASDYHSVSSANPPAKKAKDKHAVSDSSSSSQEDFNTASRSPENPRTEPSQLVVSKAEALKTESQGSRHKWDEETVFMADSDDEKLVIDDSGSLVASLTNQSEPLTTTCSTDPPVTSPIKSTSPNTDSSPPFKGTRSKQTNRRAKASGDQLGEILRMQTAMFKSGNESAIAVKSPSCCVGPQLNPHPTSLVKQCVSSYLERQQNEEGDNRAAFPESAFVNINPTEHKS
ncbi:hypothetical protein GOODEAATRI_030319 [Goodea atripinnis]|uniref:Uncharacterized protein n=1 Tax=Goodea atripinnis TaxID=208336 RepID=A0ABV0NFV7_9TELE